MPDKTTEKSKAKPKSKTKAKTALAKPSSTSKSKAKAKKDSEKPSSTSKSKTKTKTALVKPSSSPKSKAKPKATSKKLTISTKTKSEATSKKLTTSAKSKAKPKATSKKRTTSDESKAKPKAASKKRTTSAKSKKPKSKKHLIIVESPAKARTIQKFSSGRYEVKASMGHVRDLPKTRISVDVDDNYTPKYMTIRGKKEVIDSLRKGAKGATKIFLASDPDREGEAIAWHLAKLLKVENPLRIEMHEITKSAFKDAVDNPRKIDMNLVNAQQARRILDRLVGYNLSPLLWRKIRGGLSAGRVQSVAVRLICDRQKEIDEFKPEEYWSMAVNASKLKQKINDAFEAKLAKKKNKKIDIPDKKTSDSILKDLKQEKFLVNKVVKKDQKRRPLPPFKTSTLQQDAYRRLNFKAKRTMMNAQQLYEGINVGSGGGVGLITYMRTDSVRVSPGAQHEATEFIGTTLGQDFRGTIKQYANKGKTQDAHEAIRPTSVFRTPEKVKPYLNPSQFRLYKLIWERFVASQMSPCIMETTSVDINAGEYLFKASDSKVKFPGFTKVYDYSSNSGNNNKSPGNDKKLLPHLQEGEELKIHDYLPKQHFTQPPPSYTEATLIKTLEEKGIGRPSTYAPIVDTIQKRGYVILKEKKFSPTDLGFKVTDMLAEHFPNVLDVHFTAGMEKNLDLIEDGEKDWVEVIDKFYKPFSKTLSEADAKIPKLELEPEMTDEVCDKCEKPMIIKYGRFGKFMACSGYPDCKNAKPIIQEIGVPCPEEGCGGQIVERKSKKGKFYGCSNYPNCKFASWNKPLNERCKKCDKLLVLKFSKQGRVYKSCMDAKCQKQKFEEKKELEEKEKS